MRMVFAMTAALFLILSPAMAEPTHGIAIHGDLKYPPDFSRFSYVNPHAPKGGTLRLSSLGTFDSLNPFILKGTVADGLNMMGQGLVFESLMTQSEDEPFSEYGLIAKRIDVAPDRTSVTFTLRPEARWHDGRPITADDVIWTFKTFMDVGNPFFKAYFSDVGDVVSSHPGQVTFHIKNPENRELPLVIGQMVVLPKHNWVDGKHNIAESTLTPPLGSGPYKIGAIKPGAQIEFIRVDNWWGENLAVNTGRFNFDRITYDYYRDSNVALEAFFANQYDVRTENISKFWTSSYGAAPVRDGRIVRAEIPHAQPVGMQGFIYNIRRPIFSDIRVREALSYAFDYEWSNKQMAAGVYDRTKSYFENSELGATGLPHADEQKILEKYRGKIPDTVFTSAFQPPKTDGSGNNRANLKHAAQQLDAAGYKLGRDGIRVNATGQKLQFEYVDNNPALERWVMPFIQNLKKIGVVARLRIIDPAQYQNRMQNFDFDMTTMVIPQSDSPGNEQRDFWSSEKANIKGSRNYIGIKNPVIDDLIDLIVAAPTRADLVARTRALDRVLLHSHYLIPGWNYTKWRVAWWDKFNHPNIEHTKSLGITDTWWIKDPAQ